MLRLMNLGRAVAFSGALLAAGVGAPALAMSCPAGSYGGPERTVRTPDADLSPVDCRALLAGDEPFATARLAHQEAVLVCGTLRAGATGAAVGAEAMRVVETPGAAAVAGKVLPVTTAKAAVFAAGESVVGGYARYVVRRGDSLSRIAQRELGDVTAFTALFEANAEIGCSHWIFPGQALIIPLSADRAAARAEASGTERIALGGIGAPAAPGETASLVPVPSAAATSAAVPNQPQADAPPANTDDGTGDGAQVRLVDADGQADARPASLRIEDGTLVLSAALPHGAAEGARLVVDGRALPVLSAEADASNASPEDRQTITGRAPVSLMGPGVTTFAVIPGPSEGDAPGPVQRFSTVMPEPGEAGSDCAPIGYTWGPAPSGTALRAGEPFVLVTDVRQGDECTTVLEGRAAPGARLVVTDCAGQDQRARADAAGVWSVSLPAPAEADALGLVSPFSETCPLVALDGGPAAPLHAPNDVASVADILAASTVSVETGAFDADGRARLTGTVTLANPDAERAQALLGRMNRGAGGVGADAPEPGGLATCLTLISGAAGVETEGPGCVGGARTALREDGFVFSQDIVAAPEALPGPDAEPLALTSALALVDVATAPDGASRVLGETTLALVDTPLRRAVTATTRPAGPDAQSDGQPGPPPDLASQARAGGEGFGPLIWVAAVVLFVLSMAGFLGSLMRHMANGVWLLATAPFRWVYELFDRGPRGPAKLVPEGVRPPQNDP